LSTEEIQRKLQEKYNQDLCERSTEGHTFNCNNLQSFYVCSKCGCIVTYQVIMDGGSGTDSYYLHSFMVNDSTVIDFSGKFQSN
jgi:hypothetical protein